jgi:hypothetical protein
MQFSLQAMMFLLFAIAVLCAMVFSFPFWLTALLLTIVFSTLPSLLVIMIVYGGTDQRAFGIGAATALGFSVLNMIGPFSILGSWRYSNAPVGAILILALAGGAGWVSVRFRRRLER